MFNSYVKLPEGKPFLAIIKPCFSICAAPSECLAHVMPGVPHSLPSAPTSSIGPRMTMESRWILWDFTMTFWRKIQPITHG